MQNSLKYLAVLVLLFVVACAGPGENTPILEDTPETVSGEILEPGFDILYPDIRYFHRTDLRYDVPVHPSTVIVQGLGLAPRRYMIR